MCCLEMERNLIIILNVDLDHHLNLINNFMSLKIECYDTERTG